MKMTLSVNMFFWRQFLRPKKNLKKNYGSWAAVTGATDGIGRAYCDELAKQGLNILLISRTQTKLETAAAQIEATYDVQTKTFQMDLAAAGNKSCKDPEWMALRSTLEALDIGVFINNAGQAVYPAYLHEDDPKDIDNCVAINSQAVVKACYAVLPGMVARGRGAIVNVSSVVGTPKAVPFMAIYGASKAFVNQFTKSLNAEYKDKGIDIQAIAPAYVSTKMTKYVPPTVSAPTPSTYAQAAVRHIGYEAHAVPWFKHAMDRPLFHMPEFMLTPALATEMKKKFGDENPVKEE